MVGDSMIDLPFAFLVPKHSTTKGTCPVFPSTKADKWFSSSTCFLVQCVVQNIPFLPQKGASCWLSIKFPPDRNIPKIVSAEEEEVSDDDSTSINSAFTATAVPDVTEKEQLLEVPEEERFCSNYSATHSREWLNWKYIWSRTFVRKRKAALLGKRKGFHVTGTLLSNAMEMVFLVGRHDRVKIPYHWFEEKFNDWFPNLNGELCTRFIKAPGDEDNDNS